MDDPQLRRWEWWLGVALLTLCVALLTICFIAALAAWDIHSSCGA